MIDKTQLLAAYDQQLRAQAEMTGTLSTERRGPLWLGIFEGGQGFVSYPSLADRDGREPDAAGVRELVARVSAWVREHPELQEVEVKTRAHDHAPGLHEALERAGFVAQEPESVMVGAAEHLVGVPAPEGIVLERAETEPAMYAAALMEDRVFGSDLAGRVVPELLRRQAAGEPVELWAALADGQVVSAGRIDPVAGTDFAGIWGGATLPEYRGRGIYRALTSARVQSALRHGVRWIHSDSTEDSRPILERSGLVKVTETTPYLWTRVDTADSSEALAPL